MQLVQPLLWGHRVERLMGTCHHRSIRLAAFVAAASFLSGCSFMRVRGQSGDRKRGEAPDCRPSSGAVVTDTVVALTGIVVGAAAGEDGGAAIGVGAVYGASALYGGLMNAGCRNLNAKYENELELIEREVELARRREREAKAEWRPPRIASPPPVKATPPAPPAPAPAPVAVKPVKPPAVAMPAGLTDPFAVSVVPAGDPDDVDDDSAAPAAPAAGDRAPEVDGDLEERWREFWRRLP